MQNHITKENAVRKGVYLIPALFTLGNIGAGFYSIIASLNGRYVYAAWAILAAVGCDTLDGRIARLTHTTSRFGCEFDSLADSVSFAVAPAVLMYLIFLYQVNLGGVVAFLYVICGVLRLARFNAVTDNLEKQYNSGLPIPAAAGLLASLILAGCLSDSDAYIRAFPFMQNFFPILNRSIVFIMILISFLMLSQIRYNRFKNLRLTRRQPLQIFILVVVGILVIWSYPENMILILFLGYMLSGIISALLRVYRLRVKKSGNT